MKVCKNLPNFNKDLHSGDINLSKVKGNTLEEVLQSIESTLEGMPFNVDYESSQDIDGYQDSINSLIDIIIEKLLKKELLFDINRSVKLLIRKYFKEKFLPKPLTPVELNIQAVIPGTDLISEEERRSLKLKEVLSNIYEGNEVINAQRLSEFNDQMRIRLIIDTNNEKIIDSLHDLNNGLMEYQSEQYKIIRDYLKNNNFDTSLLPPSLYRKKNNSDILTLSRNYTNALLMMYNLIQSKKEKGTLSTELEESWFNSMEGEGDSSFYNAVNAYVNLTYFDSVIKEAFGDYININKNFDSPISIVNKNGIINTVYKYNLGRGNTNYDHLWGIETPDALDQMSKFLEILIRSIPIYDYETKSIEYGKLEPKDFIGAFSKLLDVGDKVTDIDFVNAINDFSNRPSHNIEIILNKLFKNPNNKILLKDLFELGIDQNIINYLYSVYRTVFYKNKSWKEIEDKYVKNNGFNSRYSIVNTLLSVINTNVSMNYAQTDFNHDTNETRTTIKARYSTNKSRFDIINNVNNLTIDRDDKKNILDLFKINTTNKKDYNITLNNFGNSITFTIIANNKSGLLDKSINSKNLSVDGISKLIDNIDISSKDTRRRLIFKTNLSEEEKTLMTVLEFIDAMLDTLFSKDESGLQELYYLLKLNKNNLEEMFFSAARALLVTDIYNEFSDARNSKKEKYSKTELLTFLSDSGIYADKIQELNDSRKKEYFIKRYDGYLLNSLRANQKWIDDLSKVRTILSGDTVKSVISNLEGSKIPNFGLGFLAAKLKQLLFKSNTLNKASGNLLFVTNPYSIKACVVNTDVVTKDGIKKLIKDMSEGELFYDAIVNKFIVPYLNDKTVFTQPTTFSDKTKFILYQVSLTALEINDLNGSNFNTIVENKMLQTIGESYKEVYENVINDYKRIFPEFVDYLTGDLMLSQVQNWLKTHKEQEFIKKANSAGVTVYKEIHYRKILKGNLSINELLYDYANNLYTLENLHNRLELEKINFINNLLAKRLLFQVDFNNNGDLDKIKGNAITKFIVDLLGNDIAKTWVKGNKLILGRVIDEKGRLKKNITYGKVNLNLGETFEINPVLNAFFMIDNLIGNNLRFSLTGSEINHNIKSLSLLDLGKKGLNLFKNFILKYNPVYDNGVITFYDVEVALKQFKLNGKLEDSTDAKAVEKIFKEQLYKIENGALNALFKRNVIIPGTMRYYLQDTLDGIRDKMKISVFDDIQAKVFNFDGKTKSIDAHDGSAFSNPFTSIIENKSLLDSEVGTVKKPILHWYDDRYMSATLLKYSIDTITNRWMLQSEGNDPKNNLHGVSLRNLFKKMTNIRWHNKDGSWKFGPIDLIEGCEYRDDPTIDFFEHILEGNKLYYRDGYTHKKIADFGIEDGVYFTLEYEVYSDGLNPVNGLKIYHYFNDLGEHIPSTQILESNPEIHTIDSLFELHTALGGIYSESIDDEGNLQFSEASNYAVVQFINNVAILKEGANSNSLTQSSYYLPLKEAMIDIAVNNTAIKNGAGNVNPVSSFYDDSELLYIEIGTDTYGIQLDSDHTSDEAQMTEFSLVISSLDAQGRLHGYVSLIYEVLGKLALDLTQIELSAIDTFKKTGNKTELYHVVARTIFNNISKNKGQAGLADAIINEIAKTFDLNVDHDLDEFKIPFSDPNIYSTILSTFVSVINNKSIKRKYPGLGTVLVPGYNFSMIYDIDEKTYLYEDLIRLSINEGFTSDYKDLSLKNRDLVLQFLQSKQNELPIYDNSEIFKPTDNVRIGYNSDVSGTGILEISLNDIEDYYEFKNDIIIFLKKRGIINPTNITYQKNITVPRNLSPSKISWEYDDEKGHHTMNIYDHWRVKGLYLELYNIKKLKDSGKITSSEAKKREKKARIKYNVQQAFDELDKGIYSINGVDIPIYYTDKNGNKVEGKSLNIPAEVIMSNIYKSKFGIKNGDTFADVIDAGPNYFKKPSSLVNSDNYDLVYTKSNNEHLYITFKPLEYNDENLDPNRIPWENKIKKSFSYPTDYKGEKNIISEVYAASKDNIPLFKIGREILRNDILYDTESGKFIYSSGKNKGKIVKNQKHRFRRLGEDQVIEYIEFISNYRVTETKEDNSFKYSLYNINRNKIKKALLKTEYTESQLTRIDKKTGNKYTITAELKFDEEVNNFISHLLSDIYHTLDFNGMQINGEVSVDSAYILSNTLDRLSELLKYDSDLSSYVKKLHDIAKSGIAKNKRVEYSNRVRTRILNQYVNDLAEKQFASFLKSQEFTASRIPAQTLLSFMQMRNVGFTGVDTNLCFVSHWQTWLQGSDY